VGAVGAYACYSYTDHVAQRRKALAGQENNLDAQLKYVRDLNSDTEKMNATTHSQLAKVEARVDHLRTQVEKGRLNAQQRSQEHEKLAQQVSAAQIQVDAGKQALQELRTSRARDSRKSAELDAEIRRLESLLAQAQQNTDAMSAQVKAFDALPSA
jgi:chromosome segregation ATPase